MWPIGGIFAYSGGAAGQRRRDQRGAGARGRRERRAATARWSATRPSQPPRDAPHNLYGHGPQLFALGGDPKPPPPLFEYLAGGATAAVTGLAACSSFHVGFDAGYDPTYTWDAASRTWKRSHRRRAVHGRRRRRQIAPTNVVVQFTHYAGEAEGADRRRGRRVGLHRRHACARAAGSGPTRTQPAQLRRHRRARRSCCARAGRGWSCCRRTRAVDVVDAAAAARDHRCRRTTRRRPRPRRRT